MHFFDRDSPLASMPLRHHRFEVVQLYTFKTVNSCGMHRNLPALF